MGFEALARILEVCYKSGVKVVTIYAFSIENYKRPQMEVNALMELAKIKLRQLCQHGDLLDRYGASLRVLGQRSMVRPDVLEVIQEAVLMTENNDKAILNVCFPYTSRDEIATSIRSIVENSTTTITTSPPSLPADHLSPPSPAPSDSSTSTDKTATPGLTDFENITEQMITDNLFTRDCPPVDLIVRTSGVKRLSDFLLWQCHKDTEIAFLDCMWPEFDMWKFLPVLIDWGLKRKKVLAKVREKEMVASL